MSILDTIDSEVTRFEILNHRNPIGVRLSYEMFCTVKEEVERQGRELQLLEVSDSVCAGYNGFPLVVNPKIPNQFPIALITSEKEFESFKGW